MADFLLFTFEFLLSVILPFKLIATGWVIAPLCGEESLDSAGQCTGEEPGATDLRSWQQKVPQKITAGSRVNARDAVMVKT